MGAGLGLAWAGVLAVCKALDEFARQNASHESTIRGLVEEAQDAFERAERKRASAAAAAARSRGNGQPEVPQSRADLINMLRRRGSV